MTTDVIANLLGAWSREVNIASTAFKTGIVIILATILGCERSRNRHAAGLRTFIVLSIGSMFAGIADLYFVGSGRVGFPLMSAGVLIGISIITANTIIFSSKNQIKGLTTSIGLWTMSILSAVLGFGLYATALVGFAALMIGLLAFSWLETYIKNKSNHLEIHLELNTRNALQEFTAAVRQFGLRISNIEVNPAYANSGLGVYTVKLTITGKELKKKSHDDIIEALFALDCVSFVEKID